MNNNICPQCATEVSTNPLYQCVRCFTVYCKECVESEAGRKCPKCGMTQRMVHAPAKSIVK